MPTERHIQTDRQTEILRRGNKDFLKGGNPRKGGLFKKGLNTLSEIWSPCDKSSWLETWY